MNIDMELFESLTEDAELFSDVMTEGLFGNKKKEDDKVKSEKLQQLRGKLKHALDQKAKAAHAISVCKSMKDQRGIDEHTKTQERWDAEAKRIEAQMKEVTGR